jgi:hypothetical protein
VPIASAAARGGFAAAAAAGAVAAPELTLRLEDVAPGVDVRSYLQLWQDQCRVVPQDGGRAALLVFTKAATARDCSDALGGGVRGAFRVDRRHSAQASGAAATAQQRRHHHHQQQQQQQQQVSSSSSRWHTISLRGSSAAAATTAARAAAADPWEDEAPGCRQAGAVASARPAGGGPASRLVHDDWEEAEAAAGPDAPRARPIRELSGTNQWAALEGEEAEGGGR